MKTSSLAALPVLAIVGLGAPAASGQGIPRLGLFGGALRTGLCSKQHVTPASAVSSSPEVQRVLARFLRGKASDYDDMSPAMAEAIRNFVRQEKAAQYGPLPWSGQSGPGLLVGVDEAGDDVYLVHRKGGVDHWNIAVDREGKIEAAYLCEGSEGLLGYDRYNAPYERGPGDKP